MNNAITGKPRVKRATPLAGEWPMPVGVWEDIAIESSGMEGSYCASDWMITVKTKDGRNKSTRLGADPPVTVAKSLLHELAQTLAIGRPQK
jgi:hypothetical protein